MRRFATALLVLFLLAGCGDDSSPLIAHNDPATTAGAATSPTDPPDGSTGPSAPTTDPPGPTVCTRNDVDGCGLAGLVLEAPVGLDEAVAFGPELGGVGIAIYRTDAVCVPIVDFSPMPGEEQEPSRFAYVDAPGIQQRRLEAVQANLSPSISGFHISQSYWTHWESEWAAAQEQGVLIEAVVVYLPEGRFAEAAADERVAAVLEVGGRRTDSLDPSYPGELFIEDDSEVLGALEPVEQPACG